MSEREMRVEDHKWFDPVCHAGGCRSLLLERPLKKLMFLAMTTGGTAGPDAELKAAIEEAANALASTPSPHQGGVRPWGR